MLIRTLAVLLFSPVQAWSVPISEQLRGLPHVQPYLPAQTGGWGQCFDVLQDDRGVLLVADLHALLTYDGEQWGKVHHPENISPLSLAKSDDGRIYAGYTDDIGYLEPDAGKGYQFRSLKPFIPGEREAFEGIWFTLTRGETGYFMESDFLYRWQPDSSEQAGGRLHVWRAQDQQYFSTASVIRDTVIVFQQGRGLVYVDGDSLRQLPHGEELAGIHPHSIVPWGDQILVATWGEEGALWYLRTPEGFKPFSREIVNFSNNYGSSYVQQIDDTTYTLCSEKNGLALFNREGSIRLVLNKARGLSDNGPLSVYESADGALWVATNFGLSRVDMHAPLTYFDERMKLRGNVMDIMRHKGRLYVATDQGLYLLDESRRGDELPQFSPVGGIDIWTWALASAVDRLMVATFDGIFEVKSSPGIARQRSEGFSAECIALSPNSNYMYVGAVFYGVEYYRRMNNDWKMVDVIEDMGEHPTALLADSDNNLWVAEETRSLRRLKLRHKDNGLPEVLENQVYDSLKGLPTPDTFFPFMSEDDVYVGGMEGFYRYDTEADRFHYLPSIGADGDTLVHDVTSPQPDGKGGVWFGSSRMPLVRGEIHGNHVQLDVPVSHELGLVLESVYVDPDGSIWGGAGGARVLNYHPSVSRTPVSSFPTLLSHVTVDEDSTLYEGLQTSEWEAPQLDHTLNTIEFKYALPYFRGDAFPEYQYRIVGLRETWSQWSQQTNRSFVRPPHGSYTFEVRGRTRIGQSARVASFEFEVLPAWYDTAWAYVFYIVLIGGLVWLLVRLNLRKSMRRQQELQRLLDRRAEEAIRQYDKARQTRIEAERLRTASQLAATIAHEFNNPLSVIAGACDLLTANHLDKPDHDKWIKRVRKQVDRMSGLVEKLLRIEDLREIDYAAGKKIIDLHVAGLEPPAGAESSDLASESDDANEDRPSSHS